MSVASILGTIIQRKKQVALTSGQRYHSLLRSVANGEEVDADLAADIVDGAGKSESDFERDVAIMQKRFSLVAQLKARNQVQATIPALEKAQADAQRRLDEAIGTLQPLAMAAAQKLRQEQNSLLQFQMVESQLQASCLDPSLIAKEAELVQNRIELVRSRSPLDDDLRRAQSLLRGQTSNIENLQSSITKNRHDVLSVASDKKDLQQARAQQEHLEETVEDLQKAISDINSELAPLEKELADIRQRKLAP